MPAASQLPVLRFAAAPASGTANTTRDSNRSLTFFRASIPTYRKHTTSTAPPHGISITNNLTKPSTRRRAPASEKPHRPPVRGEGHVVKSQTVVRAQQQPVAGRITPKPAVSLPDPPSFSNRSRALSRVPTRRVSPLILHSPAPSPKSDLTSSAAHIASGLLPTPPPSATFTPGPPSGRTPDWSESSASSSSDEVWESFSSHSVSSSLEHMGARRADSEDEDPFQFDQTRPILLDALASNSQHRASLTLIAPSSAPGSLTRERTAEGTVFVQEISGADGRRWSLRVPASGLPGDMVHMLEELETLAYDLRQALPTIVVTQSFQSLGQSVPADIDEVDAVKSPRLLHPLLYSEDEDEGAAEAETERIPSTLKEKARAMDDPSKDEHSAAEAQNPPALPAAIPSEPSLTCIYLPDFAPEFLTGSSTSLVTEPAHGFHSMPAAPCPRKVAFFSGLKQPSARAPAFAFPPPRSGKASQLRAKPIPPTKSALPVFKRSGGSRPASTAYPGPKPHAHPSTARPPSTLPFSRRASQLPCYKGASSSSGSSDSSALCPQSTPLARPKAGLLDGLSAKSKTDPLPTAVRPTGLKNLFRRPAYRSASEPPPYVPVATMKVVIPARPRPLSYVLEPPAQGMRRMPRLPSARDLLRKLR